MTDPTAHPANDEAAAEPEIETASPAANEANKIAELVEALARESADYKDKHLRTLAEMENLRRRTEREIADSRTYAITSFARDTLAVADNMARAVPALDAALRETADANL